MAIFSDTTQCRRLARGAWLGSLALYLILIYLSLGILGPYWAFLYWSVPAIPLFGLTWFWLYRARSRVPVRLLVLSLVAWCSIFLLFWVGELRNAPSLYFWVAFVSTGVFPMLLTWALLRQIDHTDERHREAAA
jgi:hypothetical protein